MGQAHEFGNGISNYMNTLYEIYNQETSNETVVPCGQVVNVVRRILECGSEMNIDCIRIFFLLNESEGDAEDHACGRNCVSTRCSENLSFFQDHVLLSSVVLSLFLQSL